MSDAVLVAIITGAFAVLGQWIITRNQRMKQSREDEEKERKREIAEAQKEERLAARLNTIERTLEMNNKKLDEHNGYAAKISNIEQNIAFIKGKMEGA